MNRDFEQYYEQYKPMMQSIVNRYIAAGSRLALEQEDLMQIASMGLYKGLQSYDDDKYSHTLETHLYANIKWFILNELNKNAKLNKLKEQFSFISIDTPIGDDNGATVADTIPDDVEIETRCLFDLSLLEYQREFTDLLGDHIKADIIITYALYDLNSRELSNMYNVPYKKVRYILHTDKNKVARNSKLLNEAYNELIDSRKQYNKARSYRVDPEKVVAIDEYLSYKQSMLEKLKQQEEEYKQELYKRLGI